MSRVLRSVGVVPVLRRPLRRYVSRPAGHKQQLEASTQIGSGAAGAPPALETTKCGGRRVTTVLIADLAPAQWTRSAFTEAALSLASVLPTASQY